MARTIGSAILGVDLDGAMERYESMSSESLDYAIAGCSQEIAVVGSVMRAALRSLSLEREVYKVRLDDSPDLARLVRSLRRRKLGGLTLSGPMGREVLRMVDEVRDSARLSGCADALTLSDQGVVALNGTYDAFCEILEMAGNQRALAIVVGSGSRACAAVAACQACGFQVIAVTSRSWTSTEVLHESESAERLRELGALTTLWPKQAEATTTNFSREMRMQFSELAASANVLIQTAPVDPRDEDARTVRKMIAWSQTRRDALVCDLVYGSAPGPFLAGAEREGLARVGGIEMLTRRVSRLMEAFTGSRPPRATLHAAALRLCMGSAE